MPKLPVLSGPEAVRALLRAGLVFERQHGSHVYLRVSATGGHVAVPCHGGRDLRPGTLRGILHDAGLNVEEFRELL